tara:strand:+ start:69 stop:260 length:192 start_codon:yes stop_codon:yes gene_type:complete
MSAEHRYENQESTNQNLDNKGKVKLTDLLSRLNDEKKKEKKMNIALSVAAVSTITVFGIILSL